MPSMKKGRASTTTTVTKRQRTAAPTKKKGWKANPAIVNVGKNPIPKRYYGTFKYTTNVTFNVVAGVASYLFNCNGMFDPDQTGAGHQPLYFDQIMAMYDHYTVLRSKIKIVAAPVSTITNGVLLAMYIDDDTSTTSDAIQASERIESVWKYGTPATGNCDWTLWLTWDAKKTFGGDVLDNTALSGTASANPTEIQVYAVKMYDPGLANSNGFLQAEIEFYACFDEFVTTAVS